MANPLFYNRIVPLDTRAHRHLQLAAPEKPFGFAAEANLIPALMEEFGAAAPFMPVAFLPGTDKPAAVFVAGLKPGSNLFIDEAGKWTGGYLPAYLRRYPFIMGDVPQGKPVLCVDETFAGFGRGDHLFSGVGEMQPVLKQSLALAENYRLGAKRSDAFCETLQRLKLFRAITLDARTPDGESTIVHGLMVVDEEALNALGKDDLAELHRLKYLKPIYEHLVSLSAISRLSQLLPAVKAAELAAAAAAVETAPAL